MANEENEARHGAHFYKPKEAMPQPINRQAHRTEARKYY